jgi:hypothetical protein
MCRYIGILIFKGLVENVNVFDRREQATAWVGNLVSEYGPDNCADSLIWDMHEEAPIELGFAHQH